MDSVDVDEETIHYHKNPMDQWFFSLFHWSGTGLEGAWLRVLSIVTLSVAWNVIAMFYPFPELPYVCHALMGFSLSLLLGFRTNSAYDRYYEGRKLWQKILAKPTSFLRAVSSYPVSREPMRTGDDLAKVFIAYTHGLRNRLRSGFGLHVSTLANESDLGRFLTPYTMDLIRSQKVNRPQVLLNLVVEWTHTHFEHSHLYQMLNEMLIVLDDASRSCERIVDTPAPYPYVVQIRQLLVLFLSTVTVVFQDMYPAWGSVLATSILAFGMLGIEEIGRIIENPFGEDLCDLPLDKFCETLEFETGVIRNAFEQLATLPPVRTQQDGHEHKA